MLVLCWQALTVKYNFSGNWTGLFCTGARFLPPPTALAMENIYRFEGSLGYDGQVYHYIAHDPFLKRGFQSSIDAPGVRYRRILTPFAAWILAFGRDDRIDVAYYTVVLAAILVLVCVVAELAAAWGRSRGWAFLCLLLPAVMTSFDRMLVDAALAALAAGALLAIERNRFEWAFACCVLALLSRETGLLLAVALFSWTLLQHHWGRALTLPLSVLPGVFWYAWVAERTPVFEPEVFHFIPLGGLIHRMITGTDRIDPRFAWLGQPIYYLGLLGMLAAVILTILWSRRLIRVPEGHVAFAFAVLIVFISSQDVWSEAIAYARIASPLILALGLYGLRERRWAGLLPLAATCLPVGIQFGNQALAVAKGLLRL
jgi:hypothetical protein